MRRTGPTMTATVTNELVRRARNIPVRYYTLQHGSCSNGTSGDKDPGLRWRAGDGVHFQHQGYLERK